MTTQTLNALCDQLDVSTSTLGADARIRHLRVAVNCAKAMGLESIPLMDKKLQPTGQHIAMDDLNAVFYAVQWRSEGIPSLLWAIARQDTQEKEAGRPSLSAQHPAMGKAFRFFMARISQGLPA